MMNIVKVQAGFLIAWMTAASGTLMAETSTVAGLKDDNAQSTGFSYRPPMRGAPAARIGGGTRSIGDTTLELVALAPDHTGLTTREQPTLYWYVSEPVPAKLEVTLINDESIDPDLDLSRMIDQNPEDRALREQMASLL